MEPIPAPPRPPLAPYPASSELPRRGQAPRGPCRAGTSASASCGEGGSQALSPSHHPLPSSVSGRVVDIYSKFDVIVSTIPNAELGVGVYLRQLVGLGVGLVGWGVPVSAGGTWCSPHLAHGCHTQTPPELLPVGGCCCWARPSLAPTGGQIAVGQSESRRQGLLWGQRVQLPCSPPIPRTWRPRRCTTTWT